VWRSGEHVGRGGQWAPLFCSAPAWAPVARGFLFWEGKKQTFSKLRPNFRPPFVQSFPKKNPPLGKKDSLFRALLLPAQNPPHHVGPPSGAQIEICDARSPNNGVGIRGGCLARPWGPPPWPGGNRKKGPPPSLLGKPFRGAPPQNHLPPFCPPASPPLFGPPPFPSPFFLSRGKTREAKARPKTADV